MPEPDLTQAIPSETEPRDGRSDDVRGRIDFLDVGDRGNATVSAYADLDPASRDGGDLACWASLVCPGCGGVTTDPAHDLQHRRWLDALERQPGG
jgi:hypothetical protein